jgi:hypothetical protein
MVVKMPSLSNIPDHAGRGVQSFLTELKLGLEERALSIMTLAPTRYQDLGCTKNIERG